jgi:hypothetical protein
MPTTTRTLKTSINTFMNAWEMKRMMGTCANVEEPQFNVNNNRAKRHRTSCKGAHTFQNANQNEKALTVTSTP